MDRSRVCGAVGFFVCEMVCAMYTGRILVSIVVSIPACHAGDPGSIPGREALFFVVCLLLIALGSTPFALPFVLLSLLSPRSLSSYFLLVLLTTTLGQCWKRKNKRPRNEPLEAGVGFNSCVVNRKASKRMVEFDASVV